MFALVGRACGGVDAWSYPAVLPPSEDRRDRGLVTGANLICARLKEAKGGIGEHPGGRCERDVGG
jgi:hypothetical protein